MVGILKLRCLKSKKGEKVERHGREIEREEIDNKKQKDRHTK